MKDLFQTFLEKAGRVWIRIRVKVTRYLDIGIEVALNQPAPSSVKGQ